MAADPPAWAPWTDADEATLRRHYGKARTRSLAARLGRTPNAVKQKAMKLGLGAGRILSDRERDAIAGLYPGHTAAAIAERLYGSRSPAKVARVRKAAERLGLCKLRWWPDDVLAEVRRLHAEGLIDRQIAAGIPGVFRPGDDGRLQVRHIRVRLGLRTNLDTEPARAARRAAVAAQHRTLGLANPNDLRRRSHRAFAGRYGLPGDLRPAQVRMVLALLAGPLTLPELKDAIGAPPSSSLTHNENKTTYQADLVGRGLLARVPTAFAGAGPRFRYLLTAACLDLLAAAPKETPR